MTRRIRDFFRQPSNLLLTAIVLLAAFLRLYKISDYMTFLGDEGRDVLIVKGILEGNLTLLGPRSSAADFFYGPIYYYMITPFLWLFRYDPVGPAVFVSLVGIATVYLVYHVGKVWIGKTGGLIAAALYAVSPIIINYSHSSWNPNPLPFVSLLSLYLVYLGLKNSSWKKFLLVGFLLGIGMQLQYLALFLAIIIGVIVLVGTFWQHKKHLFLPLLKRYGTILGGFVMGWLPFLAFEVYHGFPNLKTIFNFLAGKYNTGSSTATFFGQIHEAFFKLFGRLVMRFSDMPPNQTIEKPEVFIWYLFTLVLGLLSVVFLIKVKDKFAKLILFCWLLFGIGLFGFYKKSIYDYYFGFMFPLPFLLIGNLVTAGLDVKKLRFLKIVAVLLFFLLFTINFLGMPFRYAPNRQKDQVKTIAQFVISQTDNKPFNFALITPGNSDHAYRYYMEILGHEPVQIENMINDPERKTVTDQLLVVCEDPSCHPLGHSLFDVASFGRAEIVGEWNVSVVKVYKLVHYKGK